jgi:predicted dehydrogenase
MTVTGSAKIALFGAGLVGRQHLDRIVEHAELLAVVDPDPASQELCERIGASWFADHEKCLDQTQPDGVVVATPNHLHDQHAQACIARNIPLLIEKPISSRSETARDIVDAARIAAVPLLVGHHRRHNPAVEAAKRLLEAGTLGDIVAATGQFWLFKPEAYFDQDWRKREGAGPVFINLIHEIDLLRHLCGEIRAVQAAESRRTRGFDVEDTASFIFEFESGALGTFSLSDTIVSPWSWEFTAQENPAYPHVPGHSLMIGGTDASISLPDLQIWRHRTEKSWWQPIEAEDVPADDGVALDRQFLHFLDVIAGTAVPKVTGADGLQNLIVIEALKAAARTGARQTVALPST